MTDAALAFRRALPMLVWLVGVALGVLYLAVHRSEPTEARASRRLPVNTLLLKNDLVPDSYADRYVVAPEGIAANTVVRRQDVGPFPVLPVSLAVGTYYSLPIASDDIALGVNADSPARLCGKDGELATVKVLAVRCDPDAVGAKCFAMVQPADADVGKLAPKLAAKPLKDQVTAKEITLARKCPS